MQDAGYHCNVWLLLALSVDSTKLVNEGENRLIRKNIVQPLRIDCHPANRIWLGHLKYFIQSNRGWDGWMASLTRWTWVWANSGNWWTGRPGVLQSTGSQRVGHDWATELNWIDSVWCNFKSKTDETQVNFQCLISFTSDHSFRRLTELSPAPRPEWEKYM